MDQIEKATKALKQAVVNSAVYQNYKEAESRVAKNPQLQQQLMAFREKSYRLQNSCPEAELLQRADGFDEEYAALRLIPEAAEFLEAELRLCRMIQDVYHDIASVVKIQGLEFIDNEHTLTSG